MMSEKPKISSDLVTKGARPARHNPNSDRDSHHDTIRENDNDGQPEGAPRSFPRTSISDPVPPHQSPATGDRLHVGGIGVGRRPQGDDAGRILRDGGPTKLEEVGWCGRPDAAALGADGGGGEEGRSDCHGRRGDEALVSSHGCPSASGRSRYQSNGCTETFSFCDEMRWGGKHRIPLEQIDPDAGRLSTSFSPGPVHAKTRIS